MYVVSEIYVQEREVNKLILSLKPVYIADPIHS